MHGSPLLGMSCSPAQITCAGLLCASFPPVILASVLSYSARRSAPESIPETLRGSVDGLHLRPETTEERPLHPPSTGMSPSHFVTRIVDFFIRLGLFRSSGQSPPNARFLFAPHERKPALQLIGKVGILSSDMHKLTGFFSKPSVEFVGRGLNVAALPTNRHSIGRPALEDRKSVV